MAARTTAAKTAKKVTAKRSPAKKSLAKKSSHKTFFNFKLRDASLVFAGLLVVAVGGILAGYLIPEANAKVQLAATTTRTTGAYLGVSPHYQGNMIEFSSLDASIQSAGKKPAIANYFMNWDWSPAWVMNDVNSRGITPMITWQPWTGVCDQNWSMASFARGDHDVVAKRWAQEMKTYGKPVFLRFAHEMNQGMEFCWAIGVNGNTPQTYIAAWRHLHAVFKQVGATNVQWVWSPNIYWDTPSMFNNIYPGDAYVNWTGLDGYNFGTARSWSSWQTFPQLYRPSYDQMMKTAPKKPLMIAEFASAEVGGDKAAWIRQTFSEDIKSMPNIKAVMWFNILIPEFPQEDWRIDSSAASSQAFKESVASLYYLSNY